MRKKLKSTSGMTLIETIVALLLFAVLAAAITAVLIPVLNSFVRANDLAELTVLVENIGKEITDDLKQSTANATNIDGIELSGKSKNISIKIESNVVEYQIPTGSDDNAGILMKKFGTNDPGFNNTVHGAEFFPVFDAKYYRGKTLDITYDVSYGVGGKTDPLYTVKVDITNKDGLTKVVGNTFTARPLVLNQYN